MTHNFKNQHNNATIRNKTLEKEFKYVTARGTKTVDQNDKISTKAGQQQKKLTKSREKSILLHAGGAKINNIEGSTS